MTADLTADDPERRAAARSLYRTAADRPDDVAEFAPRLADLVDGPQAGPYAAATLRRLVGAGAIDAEREASILQSTLRSWLSFAGRGSGEERRRQAADLLAWVATAEPEAVADVESALVAALEDRDTRPGATTALYHVASRSPRAIETSVERFLPLLDDEDPVVRGDAVGIVGQLVTLDDRTVTPHFETLLSRLDDSEPAVVQATLGVLLRNSMYWPHVLAAPELAATLSAVEAHLDADDRTVRTRARELADDLLEAATVTVVQHAVGCHGEPSEAVTTATVEASAAHPSVALALADASDYQVANKGGDPALRDDLFDRIAQETAAFDTGEEILAGDGDLSPEDQAAIGALVDVLRRCG